jgi:hypothetical protein
MTAQDAAPAGWNVTWFEGGGFRAVWHRHPVPNASLEVLVATSRRPRPVRKAQAFGALLLPAVRVAATRVARDPSRIAAKCAGREFADVVAAARRRVVG